MTERTAYLTKFKYWLWGVAERHDWDEHPPRWFWRWLIKKMDRAHGWHHMDYDYDRAHGLPHEHRTRRGGRPLLSREFKVGNA